MHRVPVSPPACQYLLFSIFFHSYFLVAKLCPALVTPWAVGCPLCIFQSGCLCCWVLGVSYWFALLYLLKKIFFNWRVICFIIVGSFLLLYSIGFISTIHQRELAKGVHMLPPSWTSLPPPALSHPPRLLQSPIWVPRVTQQISVCAESH